MHLWFLFIFIQGYIQRICVPNPKTDLYLFWASIPNYTSKLIT